MTFGKLRRHLRYRLLVVVWLSLLGYFVLRKWPKPALPRHVVADIDACDEARCHDRAEMSIVSRPQTAGDPPPRRRQTAGDPHTADDPQTAGDPPTEGDPPPCTFAYRRERVRRQCQTSPPPRVNTLFANWTSTEELVVTAVIFDQRRKTLGCLVNKVASTSWFQYLVKHSRNADPNNTKVKRYRLLNYGLNNKVRVPLSKLNHPVYKNWTKYMFVRHPLQRLVSAYSQTVKKQKLHNGITFDQYMEKLGNGSFTDYDIHWARFIQFCHPCDVDYDYVIKMETLDTDLPPLNKLMEIAENATFKRENTNKHFGSKMGSEEYRYDPILVDYQRRHPDTFRKILKLYDKDMEMFGYQWNAPGNSSCGYRNGECC